MSAKPLCYRLAPHVALQLAQSEVRIVITGAGGWLGMATLELLHDAIGPALADRVICLGARARTLVLMDGTRIAQRAMEDIATLPSAPTLMLHLAYMTKDRIGHMAYSTYCRDNRKLTDMVMDALEPIGATGLFYPSSGAAAKVEKADATMGVRLYGRLKLADEQRVAEWGARTGHPTVVARLFNLTGPHINKPESYALSSFIADAIAGAPIVVRAQGQVVRSYAAIRDLMSLVFALLLEEASGVTRFDTAGERAIDVRDLAQAVAEMLGGRVEATDRAADAAPDIYVGDPEAWRSLLARYGIAPTPFATQVRETAQGLQLLQAPWQALAS